MSYIDNASSGLTGGYTESVQKMRHGEKLEKELKTEVDN